MRKISRNVRGVALVVVAVGIAIWCTNRVPAAATASCESVASLSLPNTTIASAEAVAAGAFTSAAPTRGGEGAASPFKDLAAFCRVTGSVQRAGDTDVKIEVWMPTEGWTGDFQPAASGFAGGTIAYGEMAQLLKRGAATANTNRGHDGGGPWKLSDMNDVPYHLMVEQAKSIVAAYYRSRPRFTVMNECGGGGSRDALMEVQSWPADLDAAAASGIVYYATHHGIAHMWVYQATHKTEASYIPPSKYPMIHQGALDACDANDGLTDGVIGDPERCLFDPGTLLCKNGDAPDCLTAPQVQAVRTIYATPVHARTGKKIYGSMPPGGELGWEAMAGPTPYPFAPGFYRQLVFDANWDYKTHPVNFDTDVDKADAQDHLVINANNPDVRKFIARGGKLMLIGGWNDHTLGPGSNVDYYESVVAKIGARIAGDAVRLFMVPGMDHCLGESYPTAPTVNFDVVGALKKWKATGKAPDQIVVAESGNGKPDSRRLVCAYPQVSQYKGSGATDDPSSFVCKHP
jgi:feruloyl esterase